MCFSYQKSKVIGIDISDKLITLARKNHPNAEFYVMDFEKTAFENSFDIGSILSIMYKKNLDSFLKELRRILKKNGFIYCCFTSC
jgi:ubiquinone/menaquinone biosynthesis C-methylase UbiE